jgi:hypothetical protein
MRLSRRTRRGRDTGYPAPPTQSRTCGFPASGSSVVLVSASVYLSATWCRRFLSVGLGRGTRFWFRIRMNFSQLQLFR